MPFIVKFSLNKLNIIYSKKSSLLTNLTHGLKKINAYHQENVTVSIFKMYDREAYLSVSKTIINAGSL